MITSEQRVRLEKLHDDYGPNSEDHDAIRAALATIDDQAAEIERLRAVAGGAREFLAAKLRGAYQLPASEVRVLQAALAALDGAREGKAGERTDCGGEVMHRPGVPGEYNHECNTRPGKTCDDCQKLRGCVALSGENPQRTADQCHSFKPRDSGRPATRAGEAEGPGTADQDDIKVPHATPGQPAGAAVTPAVTCVADGPCYIPVDLVPRKGTSQAEIERLRQQLEIAVQANVKLLHEADQLKTQLAERDERIKEQQATFAAIVDLQWVNFASWSDLVSKAKTIARAALAKGGAE